MNGSISQTDTTVREISGNDWLAISAAGDELYMLSRAVHQVIVLAINQNTGGLKEDRRRYKVSADVFAIATNQDGTVTLHHENGKDSSLLLHSPN